WAVGAPTDMALAAEALGLVDLAIWILEQARQKDPRAGKINRILARLYEKRGSFTQAIALWNLVLQTDPNDQEAQHKTKELAADDRLVRGRFQEGATGSAGEAIPAVPPVSKAPAGNEQ